MLWVIGGAESLLREAVVTTLSTTGDDPLRNE